MRGREVESQTERFFDFTIAMELAAVVGRDRLVTGRVSSGQKFHRFGGRIRMARA